MYDWAQDLEEVRRRVDGAPNVGVAKKRAE
jgi:hypothetical protein